MASNVSDIFQMASSSTNLNMGITNDKTFLGNDLKRKNNMQSPQGCMRGTTNACESFHRYFADHFTRHSPNIFLFLEGLNAEQERTRLKIRSHSNPIKRKDQRQKEDKRREIIGKLRGGEITMEEFSCSLLSCKYVNILYIVLLIKFCIY